MSGRKTGTFPSSSASHHVDRLPACDRVICVACARPYIRASSEPVHIATGSQRDCGEEEWEAERKRRGGGGKTQNERFQLQNERETFQLRSTVRCFHPGRKTQIRLMEFLPGRLESQKLALLWSMWGLNAVLRWFYRFCAAFLRQKLLV